LPVSRRTPSNQRSRMITRWLPDRTSAAPAKITGCPAPQTSLRSLRKLDCVGHDGGEYAKQTEAPALVPSPFHLPRNHHSPRPLR
jgi:hypothetical protein